MVGFPARRLIFFSGESTFQVSKFLAPFYLKGCSVGFREVKQNNAFSLDLFVFFFSGGIANVYPPGNWGHIPHWEKENHIQNAMLLGGYVTSLAG